MSGGVSALAISVLVSLGLGLSPIALGASDSQVKDRLSIHLGNLEQGARSERITGGVTMIGVGALSGVGALLASGSSNSSIRSEGTLFFGVAAAVFTVGGALMLVLPSEYEEFPQEWRQLPDGTPQQLNYKVSNGEANFARLANRAKNQRLVSAGTMAALGVADIVIYATSNSTVSKDYLLYQGAAFVGLGLATFFFEREAESEYREYKEWRDRPATTGFFKSRPRWAVVPLPEGGAMASMSIRF